ncbi:hypothetical protein L873DRAFT_1822630 [Choiromyces venosus 120613-1]|uniref:Uncharacterized protein n=1 Tax=Choiromyces venosus 120613-1 TaxID=1336337 RepID=A0A3N4IYZ8_9PEZI|nr:hypothetical protein L873DRAFT_1822630 [Choiromyces venosus 120613-1]
MSHLMALMALMAWGLENGGVSIGSEDAEIDRSTVRNRGKEKQQKKQEDKLHL